MSLESVTDGVAHNETTEPETSSLNADLRMHRIEVQLEALERNVAELHADLKAARFQTNTTLQYLLASLMDLQNRPTHCVQFRYPWERR